MTHLTTIVGSFQAKVVAARLGAEGIPAQLRGGIDGIYPIFNEVRVYVPSDQAEAAREILLADSVDAVFDEAGYVEPASHDFRVATRLPRAGSPRDRAASPRLVAITMVLIVVLVMVGYVAVMSAD